MGTSQRPVPRTLTPGAERVSCSGLNLLTPPADKRVVIYEKLASR